MLIPIGTGFHAAKAAGSSIPRAIGVELVKDSISFGSGYVAGQLGTKYGTEYLGPDAGRWVGTASSLVAGFGTGMGLNRIDKAFNINGTFGTKYFKLDIEDSLGNVDDIITDGSHLQNGKLKSNTTYKTGEHDYIYKTNQDGLITNASTDNLQLKTHKGRLNHNPNTYGKEVGDHAGHLFGDRFGGSPELDNLISQAQKVNQSEFKIIENQWAKALENGKKITVDININYGVGDIRPVSFDVFYTIDDIPFFQSISN